MGTRLNLRDKRFSIKNLNAYKHLMIESLNLDVDIMEPFLHYLSVYKEISDAVLLKEVDLRYVRHLLFDMESFIDLSNTSKWIVKNKSRFKKDVWRDLKGFGFVIDGSDR